MRDIVPGGFVTTLGSILLEAQQKPLPSGWLYLPSTAAIDLDTPCMFVTDVDAEQDAHGIPNVARERGFPVEGLDDHMIENVIAWAKSFRDPPDGSLLLEGFVYFRKYDAFPEAPGAGPPLPFEVVQREADRKFYDSLGAERSDAKCRREACARGAVENSALCRPHHFQMIKNRPSPFED